MRNRIIQWTGMSIAAAALAVAGAQLGTDGWEVHGGTDTSATYSISEVTSTDGWEVHNGTDGWEVHNGTDGWEVHNGTDGWEVHNGTDDNKVALSLNH
ncbi:hypothetical protein GCM10009743_23450 [Kribbella swartbergensis]